MKTLAVVFCYQRIEVLKLCAETLFANTQQLPNKVIFADDGSGPEMRATLEDIARRHGDRTEIVLACEQRNMGFAHSVQFAFRCARAMRPDYLWLIESDYVFARGGLDAVADVLENTPEGRACFGICGYDHPDFHRVAHREQAYPAEAAAMLGADPVHRPATWVPRRLAGQRKTYDGQFVSNSCISSYLNWRLISGVPAALAALDAAADPQPCAGRPLAAELAAKRCPDDGMLSNGLNKAWSEWADANSINKKRFACWLNIRPSVAQHISGGGLHSQHPELWTDAGSPSWTGEI